MNNRKLFSSAYPNHATPEKLSKISLTIPDDHLTIRELLDKHTRGEAINQHIYDQDAYFGTEIPQINDLTDLEDYKDSLKQRYQELEKTIEQTQKTDIQYAETTVNILTCHVTT